MITIERLAGPAIEQRLDALAELRIEVFRAYPYLYDGSLAYERDYLRSFAQASASCLVIARDQERVVGASTASPLSAQGKDTLAPFQAAGIAPSTLYYFGESVLLPAYRRRGIGHAFFDQREAAAREHGFLRAAFCAVERGAKHPQKPADYVPHDAFWTRRGYTKHPELVATFSWRDVGHEEQSEKPMVFWLKELEESVR